MSLSGTAPLMFAQWMSTHQHVDRRFGHLFRYHSRSDAHSVKLCEFILADLLESCRVLSEQAKAGKVQYGINVRYVGPSGKAKTFDLGIGIGTPTSHSAIGSHRMGRCLILEDVYVACEAKSTMTEHGKAQPRMFDELSSSHEIVHRENREAIAAGIAVVNIAQRFASPLRQTGTTLVYSPHKQPHVTERMLKHLSRLPRRESVEESGFDAFCSLVVECDNVGSVQLWTAPPAPQRGEGEHYDTFLGQIIALYEERFS